MSKAKKEREFSDGELGDITHKTLRHYDDRAVGFWEGTKDHDVTQNIDALLSSVSAVSPYKILDFGCGPGRDLIKFSALGHEPVGLDGSSTFVEMARRNSGCEVLHQNFLTLDLPHSHFHAVFANASLFHVPRQELPRVLRELWEALEADGVLFSSNPRGDDREGWSGDRFGCYHSLEAWRRLGAEAGFEEGCHYYRPAGCPRDQQPWLATIWRKDAGCTQQTKARRL